MVRRRVLISGRVQDVFFRDSTQREAERAGVVGWVRNTADGRVEAVFEGDRDAVEAMVSWCREGPDSADVSDVEAYDEEPEDLSGFTVR
jgi:acylphosphatase